jgi:hypothetical protein
MAWAHLYGGLRAPSARREQAATNKIYQVSTYVTCVNVLLLATQVKWPAEVQVMGKQTLPFVGGSVASDFKGVNPERESFGHFDNLLQMAIASLSKEILSEKIGHYFSKYFVCQLAYR